MKGPECNFCFVCLSNLEKVGRIQFKKGRQRRDDILNKRKRANSIKFLITYLLTNHNQEGKNYDNVLTEILYLNGLCVNVDVDGEDQEVKVEKYLARNYFRLCDKCELIAGRILELHLELEKIQMKIVEEVKGVREAVLSSSGWLGGIGGDDGDGGKEKAFENFSKMYFDGERASMEVKQTFEVLKAFQTAVSETDKSSIRVPLVHLQKYSVPQNLSSVSGHGIAPVIRKRDPLATSQDNDSDMEGAEDCLFPDVDMKYCPPSVDRVLSDPLGFENSPISLQNLLDTTGSPSLPYSTLGANPLDVKVKTEVGIENESMPQQTGAPSNSTSKIKGGMKRRRRRGESTKSQRRKLRRPIGALHKKRKYYKRIDEGSDIPKLYRVSRSYNCDSCPFTCKFISRFEQHLRDHEVEDKSYQCDQCPQGFSTQQHFFFHQGLHKGYYKTRCYLCQEFVLTINLLPHMKTHSDDAFPCSNCSKCFTTMDVYLEHARKSHVGNGKDMKCEICGVSVPSKFGLAKHLHEVHNAVPKLECDFKGCSETFLTPQSLYAHKCRHERRFMCNVCCVPFTSKYGLETHQKIHAGEREKNHRCDQCPEAFISNDTLRAHSFRVHGAAGFKCEECSKEFPFNSDLRHHRILEHGEAGFNCPVCNKKFATQSSLKRHVGSHATEKNFICDECGKGFGSLMKCNRHKRIHGEKSHQCNYCPKAFTKRTYLVEHLRTHTGEKPFTCDSCLKSFSQKGPLNVHKKRCSVLRGPVKSEEPEAGSSQHIDPAVQGLL